MVKDLPTIAIEEVESVVDGYFEECDNFRYKQDMEAIEHRWENCIELSCIEI